MNLDNFRSLNRDFNRIFIKKRMKIGHILTFLIKKLVKINQNPIFIVKFKLDRFHCSNLDGMEFEFSTIGFVSPNGLSLSLTLRFLKFVPLWRKETNSNMTEGCHDFVPQ